MSHNTNDDNSIATSAHDEIMSQVERAIRTSIEFNHESELYDGLQIYIEPSRVGGDILVYKAKQLDRPYTDPKTGRVYTHHALSPFGKPKENRPAYICPIEIKTTTNDLESVADEGMRQSRGCRTGTEHTWQYHVCIAVKLNTWKREFKFPFHASVSEAVCLVAEAQGEVYEMWRCDSLSDFYEYATNLIPDMLKGRLGRPYKKQQQQQQQPVQTQYDQSIDWRDRVYQAIYSSVIIAQSINQTQARMLDQMIRRGILKPSKVSEKYSLKEWAKNFGLSQPTFKNHIEDLQDAELIHVQTSNEGKKVLYQLCLGSHLDDVI
jgi:DNA-binding transcriptional ArsR family regulator